jgi:hypothetical protein
VVVYDPFSLCAIHKEGLYSSSRDINRLMMMIMMTKIKHDGKQLERPMSSSGLCGLMLMMMIIRFIESTTKSLQVLTLDLIAVSEYF